MKRHALIAAGLLISSCAGSPPVALGSDPFCGWNETTRAMARETYFYAQLASDVYENASGDPPDFEPSARTRHLEAKGNDEIGFAYSVYERDRPGLPPERIIAFRGTEGFFGKEGRKDWWYGNIRLDQQRRGLALYDEWKRRTDAVDKDIPIRLVGHSLGGAIAIQVSLCRRDVDTYVFNTSPRFRRCGEVQPNERTSVVEYGEVLKLTRIFGGEAPQEYNSIGCLGRADPVTQHSSRRLAECLTRIAAIEHPGLLDDEARESLDRNPTVPRDCEPRRGRRS